MARFSDNPLKSPLTGTEYIPATDPTTGSGPDDWEDISMNPVILTMFVQDTMGVANGSSNGLVDPTNYAKLLALDTQAQTDTRVADLAQVAIPVFLSSPADGNFPIYQHVCDVAWMLAFDYQSCTQGSTNVTITRNGVAIPGLTTNPATTMGQQFNVAGGSSNYTFNRGDILGLTLTGTTGNCANVLASIRANAVIPS